MIITTNTVKDNNIKQFPPQLQTGGRISNKSPFFHSKIYKLHPNLSYLSIYKYIYIRAQCCIMHLCDHCCGFCFLEKYLHIKQKYACYRLVLNIFHFWTPVINTLQPSPNIQLAESNILLFSVTNHHNNIQVSLFIIGNYLMVGKIVQNLQTSFV